VNRIRFFAVALIIGGALSNCTGGGIVTAGGPDAGTAVDASSADSGAAIDAGSRSGPCNGTEVFCDDYTNPALASSYVTLNGAWVRKTGSYSVSDSVAWQRAWSTIPGDWSDFDITIVGASAGDSGFGLVYAGDLSTGDAYAVIVHPAQFQGVYLKRIAPNQSDVDIQSVALSQPEPGVALTLRVVRNGTQVSVWLNGALQFSASDGATGARGVLGLLESTTDKTSGAGANFSLLRLVTASTGSSSEDGGSSSDSGSVAGPDAGSPADAGVTVIPVGPKGGSVTLLHFAATGDTRPGASTNAQNVATYPTQVIDQIAKDFATAGAQFVVDLGDHMNNWQDATTAQQQMTFYQQAMALYPGQWFLTMGNHECDTTSEVCIPFTGQAGYNAGNFTTFLGAVAQTGVGNVPWYSFDVQTSLGLATFVVIADNAWCPQQQSWLQQTLTTADQNATYTIVARHHPPDDTSNGDPTSLTDICTVVRQHKFSLWLTAHAHEYQQITGKDNGRDVIVGIGGAPLGSSSAYYGYVIVDQQSDGTLLVTVYDSSTQAPMSHFSVSPNSAY
jgi:hypothetical protein